MVRKLIKYDFASYQRLLLPVQLILLGIAVLNRFIQLFEDGGSTVYNIIFTSSVVLYVIAIIVCLVLTTIVAVVRFYQGMYSNEGYLSHTLPVTPTQHILSKLIVSMLFVLGSLCAVFVSACIATLGELNIELFKAGFFLLKRFDSFVGGYAFLYAIEAVLMLLSYTVMGLLMLYFCISVGQLAKKKKILLAFGVFFALYVLWQIVGTILIIIVSTNSAVREWLSSLMRHATVFLHVSLCGSFILFTVLSIIFFACTRYIMSKKLNLT